MGELLKLIQSLDCDKLKYVELMQVIRKLEEKIAMYSAASKKLSEIRDEIKEKIRLRMIKEDIPSCDTDLGRLAPKTQDCLTMANFELFQSWLGDGVILDLKKAADAEGYTTPFNFILERYEQTAKTNDRLGYLNQSCFNKQKLKVMHEDPEDTLPPGIGVFPKNDLSITKPPKTKKGAKKTTS